MLLRSKKCYIFKNIYLFLCLKVIFDTLGSFWLKNSSDFGKVQFCPELSNFSRFYPVLATGEDFSTIVRLLYKPCINTFFNYNKLLSKPTTEQTKTKANKLSRIKHSITFITILGKYVQELPPTNCKIINYIYDNFMTLANVKMIYKSIIL